MTDRSDVRNPQLRLAWLWKHWHDHDGDTTQEQITIINNTIGELQDGVAAGSGAFVHLLATAGQLIPDGTGGEIEWANFHLIDRLEFDPTLPTSQVEIIKPGYYDLRVEFAWSSYIGGGDVRVIRTRNESEIVLWPPQTTPGVFVSESSATFVDVVKAMPLVAGDLISVHVAHSDGSDQALLYGSLSLERIDPHGFAPVLADTPVPPEEGWELVWEAPNSWGVTWDGTNWWTTSSLTGSGDRLFKRDTDGSILDSYPDFVPGGGSKKHRGIKYVSGDLWAVGSNNRVYQIDPADGLVDTSFTLGSVLNALSGVTYDGTNLFVADSGGSNPPGAIEEVTTAGVLVTSHPQPSGYIPWGITWDGTQFYASLVGETDILIMDASMAATGTIPGPGGVQRGCEWISPHLYVMNDVGLYRTEP